MSKLAYLVVGAVLALVAGPASAAFYAVQLTNGTSFETRLPPQRASWDDQMILIITDQGNWIGVEQAEIEKISELRTARGYSRRLDGKTIEIGYTANDAEDGEGAGGDGGTGGETLNPYDFLPLGGNYLGPTEPVQFVDPSALGTVGIPLSYGLYGDPVQ